MYEGLPDLLDVGNPCLEGLGGDPLLEYFGSEDSPSGELLECPRGVCQGPLEACLAHQTCLESPCSELQRVGSHIGCMVQAPMPGVCLCN